MGRHLSGRNWLAGAVLCSAAAAVLHAQERPRTRIPVLDPPPPVAHRFLRALHGSLTTTIADVSFRTSLGHEVGAARIEIIGDADAVNGEGLHARLIRIVRPRVISPIDTITTPFDPFLELPVPRLRVDRLILEDGTFGMLAHPSQFEGKWLWLQQDVDVEARDIRLGGDGPEGLRLTSASMSGELRGRPLRIAHARATAVRDGLFELQGSIGLGASEIAVAGTARRSGALAFDIVTAPLAFADARTFVRVLPREGSAEIDATIAGGGGAPLGITLRNAIARVRESAAVARGTVVTGHGGEVEDVTIDIERLAAADMDSAFGFSFPGIDVVRGRIRADGPIDSVSLRGRLTGTGAGAVRALAAGADAVIHARPGEGPPRLHATADVTAIVERPDSADEHAVAARAVATAVLAKGGALDARIVADSIPFELLPLPAAIDSVRGRMRADLALGGTIDAPKLGGAIDVRDGAFRVPAARLAVHDLAGPIAVRDGVADLGGLAARANGGAIAVDGTVRLTGDRTVDVMVVARDIALSAVDTIAVVASGELRATGAVGAPLVAADARLTLPRPDRPLALAAVRGSIDFARDGALDAELRADSLPLAALPATDAVRDLRGAVRALIRAGGTIDAPTSDGRIELRGAGATIARTGTVLDALRGDAVLHDGRIVLENVTGTVGGGALRVEGEARVANGPRTVAAHATVVRGTLIAMDSAVLVASADVRADGPFAMPAVTGTVTVHDGWVHEDNFARREPIDPASPPYEDLIERVPWIADSRLRRGAVRPLAAQERQRPRPEVAAPEAGRHVVESIEAADGHRFTAQIAVDVEPGFRIIDEDSEIHGDGRIIIAADSGGARAEGIYRLTGGYYAQYGSVFEIRGGAFWFGGDGFEPRVSMRSEHRFEAPLGSWLATGARIMDRFPPLEFKALGRQGVANEHVSRASLLPESRTELGALLLYDQPVERVTGLETRRYWPPDDGGSLFGEAAGTRAVVLLASYIANESYDYLPLEHAYGRAGAIAIGPEWPGRITIGPYLQAGLVTGRLRTIVTQPAIGGTAPGIRLRYRIGRPELLAFSEPYFRSIAFGGDDVFAHRRRTGVGVRFGWEW